MSIEKLLVVHARALFREDERELLSTRDEADRIRVSVREAESSLQDAAASKLAKLNVCLERLASDAEGAKAEVKKLEEEHNKLRSLIDRGNFDRWSDDEKAEAKSTVDAALSETAKEIDECARLIDVLISQREQLVIEDQKWETIKETIDDLLASLESEAEPTSYQVAFIQASTDLEAAFRRSSIEANTELSKRRNAHFAARSELLKLERELDEACVRESKLKSARNVGWLVRRLDPRSILGRKSDAIRSDLNLQQSLVGQLWSTVTELGTNLEEMARQHDQQLTLLPIVVRQKLLDKTTHDANTAALRLAEISRMSDEVSASLLVKESDLVAKKGRYHDEYRRNFDACLKETLRQAERSLVNIDARIPAELAFIAQLESKRTRLIKVIGRRRAKLDASLLDIQLKGRSALDNVEREANRLHQRLLDRASRAGMVFVPATNSYREQDVSWNITSSNRASFRQNDKESVPAGSLPVLLRRRSQTGYIGKDDERLSTVVALILGKDEPAEVDRAGFIDGFIDVFFGDEDDEREFLVSIVSTDKSDALVLIRPEKVLPQLRKLLPDTMSLCVLGRLRYGEAQTPDNTTVYVLDVALVTDSEPRPFERSVLIARHVSRSTLPLASNPLVDLLESSGSQAPVLLTALDDRLEDWNGYLDWANEQVLREAPWGMLGPGEWKRSTWEGVIFCEDKRAARALSGAGKPGDSRQMLCVYQLNEKWRGDGNVSDKREFRCTDYQVLADKTPIDAPDVCPWPNLIARRVSMSFPTKDAPVLAELFENAPIGLRDITDAVGRRALIKRHRTALQQLQTVFFDQDLNTKKSSRSNRLPAAPYLMATLFNVSQAASPVATPGRMLNADISKLYRLNPDQGAAVEVMLSAPDIAYIQGPPGTGKTTMIAAACAHFVRSGYRVLIASQTNLAVENALERLIGDPEVRPLWLSKNEGEQKKSAAIADWHRMAADHVDKVVCRPFRSLSDEVKRIQSWLERARRCELDWSRSSLDLKGREDDLHRSVAVLTDTQLRLRENSEDRARKLWWAMAHGALDALAEWDPSCFSPNLAPDATELLKLFAASDGKSPRLDVSPGALHRQVQERIQQLQIQLNSGETTGKLEEADRLRKQILGAWPSMILASPSKQDGSEQISLQVIQAEAVAQRARQSLEDAKGRQGEIDVKVQALLSEICAFMDWPQAPADLRSAIDLSERHAEMEFARLMDVEPIRDWLPLLDQWNLDLSEQISNPSTSDTMGERYVNSANVIGITCNSDFKILSESGFSRFDVVIIDEVSKATPLELLRPMLLAPKSILVGDHRQLPPTFEFASHGQSEKSPSEDEDPDALEREAELLRKYERLNTASLFRNGFAEIDPGARATLFTQYRMHPQIMALVNRFYDGRLESGLIDPDGLSGRDEWSWRQHGLALNSRTGGQYLSPHQHALWIDSSQNEEGRLAYENSDNTGIGNELEARLVAQIVEDIVYAFEKAQRKKSIAVATFYNRQKVLIRECLKDKLGRRFMELQIDVETVDRFQGKEADIVIVSMVRSPQQRRLGRNSNPAKFERINVAFSRARDLLVVVGARKTFESFEVAIEPLDGGMSRRTRVYGQIISDIRDAGGLWQAKDILGENSRESKGRSK